LNWSEFMPATLTGISLLSALRALGSAVALIEIPDAFFTEPEELAALHWLRGYVNQHHRFPGITPFRRHCGFSPVITLEPLSYYRDRARQLALYKEITQRRNAFKETIINKTPDETIRLARELVALEQQFGAWASEQTFAQALDQVEAEFEGREMGS
jgi:hypothetical protein